MTTTASPLTTRPLQEGLPFGIRIGGLTRSLADDPAVREQINQLFVEHGVIVFEDVEPTDDMQLAISTIFGPLKPHPVKSLARDVPGVIELRTAPDSGGIVEIDGQRLSHWLPWHFDHCYNDELNLAGVLRATVTVEIGGLTGFCDGAALYEAFPEELLARIEGQEILYHLDSQYDLMRFGLPREFTIIRDKPLGEDFKAQAAATPRAIHPAVWAHGSGKTVLHVSPYMAVGVLGHEDAEGDALLEEVSQTINELAKGLSYHHKWKPSDMLIWDNSRVLHSVSGNRPEDERVMMRTTIKGDYGLGRFEAGAAGDALLSNTMV